jgi:hypothetical protein
MKKEKTLPKANANQSIVEQLKASNISIPEPVYPILVHEDAAGLEDSVIKFINMVKPLINDVRAIYNSLKLDEPFNDHTWKSLCTDPDFLNKQYQKKITAISDIIGITEGITIDSILNKTNPLIRNISTIISELKYRLVFTESRLLLEDVVNVNSTLELSQQSHDRYLETFKYYVNNQNEAIIKSKLDRLAIEYKSFTDCLVKFGYGPHIGNIHSTYLANFFDLNRDGDLVTNPTAWSFLAKFNK